MVEGLKINSAYLNSLRLANVNKTVAELAILWISLFLQSRFGSLRIILCIL